jgi:DNA polymerase II large subunit
MSTAGPRIKKYFQSLQREILKQYKIAEGAREKGFDPSEEVEIKLAKNSAERVVGLISVAAPQIIDSGVTERIIELEKKYGKLDWRIACVIAHEISEEKFCKFKDRVEAIEIGIRTGFAYVTVGVVSAPLEGFTRIELKKRKDDKEYFAMYFSGPIRNAGGTAASVAVIIADYVRTMLGYATYDPDEKEIGRVYTELMDYHERIANLQYKPNKQETKFLVKHLPIEIAGDPTERLEVSNYRDLPRISTNRIRGGFCLVLSECIPQKAPKLWKNLSRWGEEMNLSHWNFLKDFVELQKGFQTRQENKSKGVAAIYSYIQDTVGGRPVLAHPMRPGGFRLRYGHSRTNGYSAQSLHPATLEMLDGFIATATQAKVERPGKATAYTTCDSIEPPIVRLTDGSIVKIRSWAHAKEIKSDVNEIIFLGDVLVNYGDFYDRAHMLVPPGYCHEWWLAELEKSAGKIPKPPEEMTYEIAKKISDKYSVPLHPEFTHYWKLITGDSAILLHKAILEARSEEGKLIFKSNFRLKRTLESIGCEHLLRNNEYIVIESPSSDILNDIFSGKVAVSKTNGLSYVNELSSFVIKDKAGTFVGARMGRPEKAKMRKLKGAPHGLFPVGEEGGRMHSIQAALDKKQIVADVALYYCESCKKQLPFGVCHTCGKKAEKKYMQTTGELTDNTETASSYRRQAIDIVELFKFTLKQLELKSYPELVKGITATANPGHYAEHLAKAILRAQNDLYVNKDGTVRYDSSEVPITHFKPKEVATPFAKLKKLGYNIDIHGDELVNDEQILELFPQDVILPCCPDSPNKKADDVFFATTKFVDKLLSGLYGGSSYYNLKTPLNLVGHLVIGLAPHTSAGIIGRIIGFSKTQGMFCHPYFHAAMRRDADGDESCFILLMDALLNFSKKYLTGRRGSTMDAPLVLTSILEPSEVDDMAFNIDRCWQYPLEFYEAAEQCKMPWDVKIELIGDTLDTEKQYEGMGFTHDTNDFNEGVLCSAYKLIPSMQEKVDAQMALADKIRAVDAPDVARIVIETHFIKDTKGNLRKFSKQQFRCVTCNKKYRRPPLKGRCSCGGKIIFTVAEGSVIKYLEPSLRLARKYKLSTYLMQTLELTKLQTRSIFGGDREKQSTLLPS